jgi:diguanylate cyclase (GGDEF)-like protein
MKRDDSILIVDDAVDSLQALAGVLNSDYTVILAKNGEQALERLRETQPDMVLLDVLLPDINGFDLLQIIRETPFSADIPVLMITQLNQPEDEVKSLTLGATDFIQKPINPGIVRARVRNHMRVSKQLMIARQLAMLDGLTGLPNRRQFDQVLAMEFIRFRRNDRPLSLVMIDIDRFKLLNDAYGHSRGDEILRAVASKLAISTQRPGDLVARYGGEEFVAILPDTDQSGAITIAEGFRSGVAALGLPHPHAVVDDVVTISLGVATLTADDPELSTVEAFLKKADTRLYRAKEGGRNQVCSSDAP